MDLGDYPYLSELIYDDLTMICERNHIGVICQSVTCHVILISVLYFVDFVEFSQVVVLMSSKYAYTRCLDAKAMKCECEVNFK
jgi:hypothetical protein